MNSDAIVVCGSSVGLGVGVEGMVYWRNCLEELRDIGRRGQSEVLVK